MTTVKVGDREYEARNKAEEVMLKKWNRVLDKAEKDINFKIDKVTDMKFVNAETGEVIKTFGPPEVHTERNTKRLNGIEIVDVIICGDGHSEEEFSKACEQAYAAFDTVNEIVRVLDNDDCSNGTKIGYIEDIIKGNFGGLI